MQIAHPNSALPIFVSYINYKKILQSNSQEQAQNMDWEMLFQRNCPGGFLGGCFLFVWLFFSLAISPIGDAFRNRLRMFPSLINCCTIDWFQTWPTDALEMVANKFLEDVELEDDIRKEYGFIC